MSEPTRTITVPVNDDSNVFLLKQHLGEGAYGDHELQLASVIPTGSPVVTIDGVGTYSVNIHDIVKGICAAVLGDEEADAEEAADE